MLLKIRKGGIKFGLLSIILLTTFLAQLSLLSVATNPLISNYLNSQLIDEPNLFIRGKYRSNLSSINSDILSQLEIAFSSNSYLQEKELNDSIENNIIWLDISKDLGNYYTEFENNSIKMMPKLLSDNSYQKNILNIVDLLWGYSRNPSNISQEDIDGLLLINTDLYGYEFPNKTLNLISPSVLTVKLNNTVENDSFTYNLNLVISNKSYLESLNMNNKLQESYNRIELMNYISQIGVLYLADSILYTSSFVDSLEGGEIFFNHRIVLSKDMTINYLFNSPLFNKKISNFLDTYKSDVQNQNFYSVFSNSDIDNYLFIINNFRTIFVLLQFIILFPLFIFILFVFYHLNSIKNEKFNENFLYKILAAGFTRKEVLSYLLAEIIIILFGSYIISNILSISLLTFSLLITQDYFWKNKIELISKLFLKSINNPLILFVIGFILIVSNFKLFINIITGVPSKNIKDRSSYIPFKIKNQNIYLIKSIVFFSGIFCLIFSYLNLTNATDVNLVLINVLLQIISLIVILYFIFIEIGLALLRVLLKYLGKASYQFEVVRYLFLSHKKKVSFISVQIISLVILLTLIISYNTYYHNGIRQVNLVSGADVVIESKVLYNETYYSLLKQNTSFFSDVTVVNTSQITITSPLNVSENINIQLISINPENFFEIGYCENNFFQNNTIKENKNLLQQNNKVIIFKNSFLKYSELVIQNKLNYKGRLENINESISLNFTVIDTFELWPKLTDYEDTPKQDSLIIVMSRMTFNEFFDNSSIPIQTSYWMKFQENTNLSNQYKSIYVPNTKDYERSGIYRNHPLNIGISILFDLSLSLSVLYLIFILIQLYYVVYSNLFNQLSSDIGIFRSIGISMKKISSLQVQYFFILNSFILITTYITLAILQMTIRSLFVLMFFIPINIPNVISIVIFLFIIQLITSFTPYIFKKRQSMHISKLLKIKD